MRAGVSNPLAILCILVGLWWCGLFVMNIVSKKALIDKAEESITHEGLTTESLNLVWVELTALQNIVASFLSILCAKCMRQSLWTSPALSHKKIIFVAALCHFLGTLAANATYTFVVSDLAILFLAAQPLFTLLFMMKTLTLLDVSKFLSLMPVVIGVGALQMNSSSLVFNYWGLVAAILSSMSFAGRNVLLKEGIEKWDNTLEKFTFVTSLSAIFSWLLWIFKACLTGTFLTTTRLGREGMLAYIIYPGYSFTSLKVLETVSPVTHALVAIWIRLFGNIERILTFAPVNFGSHTVFCLFLIVAGFYLYHRSSQQTKNSWIVLKLSFIFAIVAYLLALNPNCSLTSYEAEQVPPSDCILSMTLLRQLDHRKGISTAWLYDRPITESVVANIGGLADNNPTMKVYVYCGTTQCVREVAALEKENVVVGFAVVSDIVKGTSLERWVARHPINKLLAGQEFENHLQEVAILGILWQYGGYYVNPMMRTKGSLPIYHNGTLAVFSEEATVSKGSLPSLFDALYFSKNHSLIKRLTELYIGKYPDLDYVWKTILSECKDASTCLVLHSDGLKLPVLDSTNATSHYGILLSQSSPQRSLDDELENFAGLQYLPYVDTFLQRDNLQLFNNVTAFFNGKWRVSEGSSVPLNSLNPIMLSVHIESGVRPNWNDHLDYLQKHEPIGCRDASTLDYLQTRGIEAFSPSSLMLVLKNPNSGLQERVHVYVTSEYFDLLPPKLQASAIVLTPTDMEDADALAASKKAHELMEIFASAKLVITDNLQYALSCVALDTPVVFINTTKKDAHIPSSLFTMVDMHTTTDKRAKEWFQKLSWNNISHNPDPAMLMRLRATSWNIIRKNQHLYDTALRFGVVPMPLPRSVHTQPKLVFYLVFSTSNDSSLSITWSFKKQSGRFNWRHWRSIESVFHHHPNAEVRVYSNTLPSDFFNILTEAGYSIKVYRYNFEHLLYGTPAEGFIKKLRKARKGAFWYANASDLLRVLLVYQYGGIYMDTDIFVVKPLDSLQMNSIGWQDGTRGTMNGAFFKFEKGNRFLEACLKDYVKNYNGAIWAHNGPKLLTRVYHEFMWSSSVVNVVDYKLFYMIDGNDMNQQCFKDTEGNTFKTNVRILHTEAYVFHMNSKISGNKGIAGDKLKNGTLCKHLLNSYCVLCDQIH